MDLAVRRLLPLALLLLLPACNEPSSVSNGARNLILTKGPAGFNLTLDVNLDPQQASVATPADPKKTLAQLNGDLYAAGWARTWTKGGEDLEILEFAFGDGFHARDFVHFDLLEVGKGLGVIAAPHPTVPDSTIFTFTGKTRARTRQVFCEASWFVVAQYAFEVTDCSDVPLYPNLMSDITQAQYLAATGALNLPAQLTSPSPEASPTP